MRDSIIELYEGNLGGGKTYSVVWRLFNYLVKGHVVITNIDLCWDHIKKMAEKRKGVVLQDRQLVRLTEDNVFSLQDHIETGKRVAPLAGAWIETARLPKMESERRSRPSRARGLKQQDYLKWNLNDVAPLAGAWIETSEPDLERQLK